MCAFVASAADAQQLGAGDLERVALYPTPGFNLEITERDDATLTLAPQTKGAAHNWFAGLLTDLPTGREVTLAVNMKGQDTDNRADVGKWKGLRPVMSYADPNAWATYVTYERGPDGVWRSDDPFAPLAGRAVTPNQSALPPALAPLFLREETRPNPSPDPKLKGKDKTIQVTTWSAWRELEDVSADTKTNRFLIREKFALPHATVAMRVPFLPSFHEEWARRLALKSPHLLIERIGQSPSGLPILVFTVQDAASTERINRAKPTILLTAREHATEQASSWALYGLVMELLRDSPAGIEMRQSANWLVVPLQDPEGAQSSTFVRMTESFSPRNISPLVESPPEIWDYMKWLRAWVDDGRTLDAAVSLHNVESDESPNLSTPFADNVHVEATDYINGQLFPWIKKAGFDVGGAQSGQIGASPFRLYGWASLRFGALPLAYEVNDRWPKNRLSHAGLQRLGVQLGLGLARWCESEHGRKWHRAKKSFGMQRQRDREAAYAAKGAPTLGSEPARYDLLTKGY